MDLLENQKTKLKALQSMLQAAQSQKTKIEREDADGLQKDIETRAALMKEIDALDEERAWLTQTRAQARPDGEDRDIKDVMDACRDVAGKIAQIDDGNRILLQDRMKGFRSKINAMHREQAGLSSYMKPYRGDNNGIYFDAKK